MVCRNLRRSVRFRTQSASVCQWCITELKSKHLLPSEVNQREATLFRQYFQSRMDKATLDVAIRSHVSSLWRDSLAPKRAESREAREARVIRAHHLGLIPFTREVSDRITGEAALALGRSIRVRDHWQCTICIRKPRGSELHVHHIIPLSCFGTNARSNLATVCLACHRKQHPEVFVDRMSDVFDEIQTDQVVHHPP